MRRGDGDAWPREAVGWRSVTEDGKGNGGASDSGGKGLVQADQETRESEANFDSAVVLAGGSSMVAAVSGGAERR
jgi:1-aminocyclopropane-1-carboxylate deaminase/D-cysteine desulfhydrase-like pyridoxal-dependent ACC family enzyme